MGAIFETENVTEVVQEFEVRVRKSDKEDLIRAIKEENGFTVRCKNLEIDVWIED